MPALGGQNINSHQVLHRDRDARTPADNLERRRQQDRVYMQREEAKHGDLPSQSQHGAQIRKAIDGSATNPAL